MSEIMNVPGHKPRQRANAARVTLANAGLHGLNDVGHRKDRVTPDPVRYEAAASTVPGADTTHAARTADRSRRPAEPVTHASPFNPEDTSSLTWWRTLPSDRLGESESLLLNTTLARIGVMHGGYAFTAALRGEAGAAGAMRWP
jgi:hypothetical protein